MKRIIPFFASLLVIAFFSSCQKQVDWNDITTPVAPTPASKIKTYTEDVNITGGSRVVTTFNLEYDASNRLVSMTSASNPGDKFLFQYSSNSFTTDIYNSNSLTIHQVSFLNSFSLVDSTFQYNDTQDTMTEKYLYNSAKQLVKLKEYDYKKSTGAVLYNTHDYLYDNIGNQISDKDSFSVTTYEYTNLKYDFALGPDHFYKAKNLVKTTQYTSGGSTGTLNHTYTFDSNNRLSTETITGSSNGTSYVVIRTYTY
ncbi:MAG TPA: hypothetical protein VF622_18430 [Segetibacter sp.]|jgi:hypothetical protein